MPEVNPLPAPQPPRRARADARRPGRSRPAARRINPGLMMRNCPEFSTWLRQILDGPGH